MKYLTSILVFGVFALTGCYTTSNDTNTNSTSSGESPQQYSPCENISPASTLEEAASALNKAKLCQPVSAYCPSEKQIVNTETIHRMFVDLFAYGVDGPPWGAAYIIQSEEMLHDAANNACADIGKALYGIDYYLNNKTGYLSFQATCSSCVEKAQCGEPGQLC